MLGKFCVGFTGNTVTKCIATQRVGLSCSIVIVELSVVRGVIQFLTAENMSTVRIQENLVAGLPTLRISP